MKRCSAFVEKNDIWWLLKPAHVKTVQCENEATRKHGGFPFCEHHYRVLMNNRRKAGIPDSRETDE